MARSGPYTFGEQLGGCLALLMGAVVLWGVVLALVIAGIAVTRAVL